MADGPFRNACRRFPVAERAKGYHCFSKRMRVNRITLVRKIANREIWFEKRPAVIFESTARRFPKPRVTNTLGNGLERRDYESGMERIGPSLGRFKAVVPSAIRALGIRDELRGTASKLHIRLIGNKCSGF